MRPFSTHWLSEWEGKDGGALNAVREKGLLGILKPRLSTISCRFSNFPTRLADLHLLMASLATSTDFLLWKYVSDSDIATLADSFDPEVCKR